MTLSVKRKAKIIRSLQDIVKRKESTLMVKDLAREINVDLKVYYKLSKNVLGTQKADTKISHEGITLLLQSLKGTGIISKEKAEQKPSKRMRYKLVHEERPESAQVKIDRPSKRSSIEDFLSMPFADDNVLLRTIKKLKFVKSRNVVKDVFQKISPFLNEVNASRCYSAVLKRIPNPRLKVYFSNLFIIYSDTKGISYSEAVHTTVKKYEKEIVKLKAKNRWGKRKNSNNKTSLKGSGGTVSSIYGSPGNYGKLISNLPRS